MTKTNLTNKNVKLAIGASMITTGLAIMVKSTMKMMKALSEPIVNFKVPTVRKMPSLSLEELEMIAEGAEVVDLGEFGFAVSREISEDEVPASILAKAKSMEQR